MSYAQVTVGLYVLTGVASSVFMNCWSKCYTGVRYKYQRLPYYPNSLLFYQEAIICGVDVPIIWLSITGSLLSFNGFTLKKIMVILKVVGYKI